MEITDYRMEDGKVVRVFDDCLSFDMRNTIYAEATKSSFKIGWHDTEVIENQSHKYLYASYSEEQQLKNLGVLFMPIIKELNGKKIARAALNLSTPSDVYFPHSHPGEMVLLFYVNLNWQPHWFGETLFYNNSLRSISLALPYTPGRIVWFDGGIPHALRPQSQSAPFFRFTLAIFFKE